MSQVTFESTIRGGLPVNVVATIFHYTDGLGAEYEVEVDSVQFMRGGEVPSPLISRSDLTKLEEEAFEVE